MIEGHHINEVKRDRGHDAYGNILSLCKYHHRFVHKNYPLSEPLLTVLDDPLISEKIKRLLGEGLKTKGQRCLQM
jgi:predicted restriction endonuclease